MRDGTRGQEPRSQDREAGSDDGWTLVELLISMTIFIGLLGIVFTILLNVSLQAKDNLARTRSVSEAQLGLMQIDRQVRSGNVISDPSVETLASSGVEPYYSLRVYTQTDGVFQCVQWRVIFAPGADVGALEYRSWRPDWTVVGGVRDWSVVARNVVRPAGTVIVDSDPSTWPPFYVDPASVAQANSAAQTIRVTLRLKDPEQRASSQPASVTSVLTGRNTVFGYPADKCGVVPPP
ncbi:type II secretion system protein J [Cellulomonas sp. P22]|uniref:type II secretion system protein J n=1 Tax=Cellulomonas sp. P22 TaxID=3373189 RepID=UPI0037B4DDCE